MAHDSGWTKRPFQWTEIGGTLQLANWRAGDNYMILFNPFVIISLFNLTKIICACNEHQNTNLITGHLCFFYMIRVKS